MTQRQLMMMRSVVLPGWGQFSQGRGVAGWSFLLAGLVVAVVLLVHEPLGVPALVAWLDVALVAALAGWDAARTAGVGASAR